MKTKLLIAGILAIAVVAISVTTMSALISSSSKIVALSSSEAQTIFGGSWEVLQNQTYLKVYPTENITIYYANGTNVTIPYPQHVKSLDHEVLVGNINGTKVKMVINVVQFTSNVSHFVLPLSHLIQDEHHHHFSHDFMLIYNSTEYNGYRVIYFASTSPYPHTILIAYKGTTLIEVTLNGYVASITQMEEVLNYI
ncbi:zinc ribbon domain-containing protein [Sulfolobus sp. E11-6]|uniref:zinc ribbon domain-containing protein n=1 Tax=Sulfolobus sp. E11-6 TaxID=2663020 RepID=UPI0012970FEB|nr:zinc ribbon domain-containing protein [Sulfolobus sp. E11-6]QGA69176.1 zinc ribbon domain-containing protein [Sulfolobus sp. E11-6]